MRFFDWLVLTSATTVVLLLVLLRLGCTMARMFIDMLERSRNETIMAVNSMATIWKRIGKPAQR